MPEVDIFEDTDLSIALRRFSPPKTTPLPCNHLVHTLQEKWLRPSGRPQPGCQMGLLSEARQIED